jgi:hypothetical protein
VLFGVGRVGFVQVLGKHGHLGDFSRGVIGWRMCLTAAVVGKGRLTAVMAAALFTSGSSFLRCGAK